MDPIKNLKSRIESEFEDEDDYLLEDVTADVPTR